ncbi:MAG: ATP-binding cassette domain-containing protein [Ruminococcus sp.]|nr:ATP-binding cassette domain-containing protein [Ruminococcus sp.]
MEKKLIISVKDLVKTFTLGDNIVKAVNHVSFDVYSGEMVAITGKSGIGKSTLLNLLGGLDKPDSGTVTVDGKEITSMKDKELAEYRRKSSGFVFQFFNLISVLNVEENLALPLNLDGKEADEKTYTVVGTVTVFFFL